MEGLADFCDICKVFLNGPEPKKDHYSSKKHIKKAANISQARQGRDYGRAFCECCNTYSDTEEQLAIHKQSPAHKSQEEKATASCHRPSPAATPPMQPVHQQHPIPLNVLGNTASSRPVVTVDQVQACFAGMTMSGAVERESAPAQRNTGGIQQLPHSKVRDGAGHAREVWEDNYFGSPSPPLVNVTNASSVKNTCPPPGFGFQATSVVQSRSSNQEALQATTTTVPRSISCNHPSQLNDAHALQDHQMQHLSSHLLEQKGLLIAGSGARGNLYGDATHVVTAAAPGAPMGLAPQTALPPAPGGPAVSLPDKDFTFDPVLQTGRCYLCEIALTSLQHMQQHVDGKRHQKARSLWMRKKELAGSSGNDLSSASSSSVSSHAGTGAMANSAHGKFASNDSAFETDRDKARVMEMKKFAESRNWLWCDVCAVSVNTLEQLDIHNRSPKHINRQKKQTLLQANVCGMANSTGTDKTVWHQCGVCGKKVNSQHQLEIHLQSHPPAEVRRMKEQLQREKQQQHPDPGLGSSLAPGSFVLPSSGPGSREFQSPQSAAETQLISFKSPSEDGNIPSLTLSSFHTAASLDEKVVTPASQDSMGRDTDLLSASPENLALSTEQKGQLEHLQDGGSNPNQILMALPDIQTPELLLDNPSISDRRYQLFDFQGNRDEWKDLVDAWRSVDDEPLYNVKNPDDNRPFPGFHSFCELCNVPFNARESEEAHYRGKKHKANLAKSDVSAAQNGDREGWPNIVKFATTEDCDKMCYDVLGEKVFPREYQIELYTKAMSTNLDAVCFLPTGTGKTLVATMVMSHMLQKNPYHSVVFVVDKVLLVLQQSGYIKTHIGEKDFTRYDNQTRKMATRNLKIAALCGGQNDMDSIPISHHDVIIVTAAYFMNMLGQGSVRWQDNSLVVFDEAHHCAKRHPFCELLQKHHHVIPAHLRPKILGLTASPAGQLTVAKTETMLETLLGNIGHGNTRLIAVEKEIQELDRHASTAKLVIKEAPLGPDEAKLKGSIERALGKCKQWLLTFSNLAELLPVNAQDDSFDSQFESFAEFNASFDKALPDVRPRRGCNNEHFYHVISHSKKLYDCLTTLGNTGLSFAQEVLEQMIYEGEIGNFPKMEAIANVLDTELYHSVLAYHKTSTTESDERLIDNMPAVALMLKEVLEQVNWQTGQGTKRPIVLVLVKQRKDAISLAKMLQQHRQLINQDIQTTWVVGHGASKESAAKGMSTKQQDRTLKAIQSREFQIIVATSVAEEGVDLPTCELVIQMDPPTSVRALVQVRGRARQFNSRFVAVCRSHKEKGLLEQLLCREEHMKVAAANIIKRSQTPPMLN